MSFFGSDKIMPRNHAQDIVVGTPFSESVLWVPVDPTGTLPVTVEVLAAGSAVNGTTGGTVTYNLYHSGHIEVVATKVVSIAEVSASDIIRKY